MAHFVVNTGFPGTNSICGGLIAMTHCPLVIKGGNIAGGRFYSSSFSDDEAYLSESDSIQVAEAGAKVP